MLSIINGYYIFITEKIYSCKSPSAAQFFFQMSIPAFDPLDHLGECRALFDLGYMLLSHILVTDFG